MLRHPPLFLLAEITSHIMNNIIRRNYDGFRNCENGVLLNMEWCRNHCDYRDNRITVVDITFQQEVIQPERFVRKGR